MPKKAKAEAVSEKKTRRRTTRGASPHLGVRPSSRPGPATDLTEYGDIWFDAYEGSEPPWGEMGRVLLPWEKPLGRSEVLRRFRIYCAETPARFASATRFGNTIGTWIKSTKQAAAADPMEQMPGESLDAYTARLAGMGRPR